MKYVNIQKDQFNVFLAQTLQEMHIFFYGNDLLS